MTVQRWLAVALAGVLSLAACSSGRGTAADSTGTGKPDPGATASVSLPPNPYLSPFTKQDVKVDVPAPKPTATICPTPDANPLVGKTVPEQGSWIIAGVDGNERWEKRAGDCPYLFYGADCWIPFKGAWKLVETPQGSIVFQVFENGSSNPLISTELGPVPNGGRFAERTTGVPYKPGKNTRTVTFRLLLKDATGRVVASSDPETLPVPGCKLPSAGSG